MPETALVWFTSLTIPLIAVMESDQGFGLNAGNILTGGWRAEPHLRKGNEGRGGALHPLFRPPIHRCNISRLGFGYCSGFGRLGPHRG